MWYRLMCKRCKQPYSLYPGYRFFVALDVTLRCCGVPQQLEQLEPVSRTWHPCREQVTPRAFYELTGQPVVLDVPHVDSDEEEDTVHCYTCGRSLSADNRKEVYIEGGAFLTTICADDPDCADDEDIQLYKPVLVTCASPDEECGEEYYASKDKPLCPACGWDNVNVTAPQPA